MEQSQKKKKKKNIPLLIAELFFMLIFLAGTGILLYPTASDLWNNYRNGQLMTDYMAVVSTIKEEDYTKYWQEARIYNSEIDANVIKDTFDEENQKDIKTYPYEDILNPMGNRIMGFIDIPKINVRLAIYHGTSAEVLDLGCGHIEGTCLPIGGIGNHSVLSAHRGLPSAKLFTDLDLLVEGDIFVINVLNEKLAYKVDQILTVLPSELEALAIEPDKDLVTLVTCTPYGINSHRLLVRGIRTEYTDEELKKVTAVSYEAVRSPLEGLDEKKRMLVLGGAAALVGIFLLSILFRISDRRKRKRRERERLAREKLEQEKKDSE